MCVCVCDQICEKGSYTHSGPLLSLCTQGLPLARRAGF